MSAFPKAWLIAAHVALATSLVAVPATATSTEPEFPVAYNKAPTNKIKYDDLDFLMKQTVLKTGRSDHKSARKPENITGTRVSFDNPNPSRLEGNRVLFHQNRADLVEVSREIRDAMLSVPGQIKFSRISRNEQLAYWLNLHNIIVYHEIAKRYPISNLKDLFADCAEDEAIYCDRTYNMAGQMISLKDIRDHVVENWDDPLVIYGFYHGAVGTPNVRNRAYKGSSVWNDLRENAVDFIHSVRGSRAWSSKTMRVSRYYTNFPKYFPDFERDVLEHVRDYAEGEYLHDIRKIKKVKANVDDWYIADLYNGHLNDPAGVGNLVRADPRSRSATSDIPLHAKRLLAAVVERNKKRRAVVGIEEVITKDDTAKKETEESNDGNNGS